MKLQISEDEIKFLTEGDDPYSDNVVMEKLFHSNLKLLIVTDGPQGCRYYTKVRFGLVLHYNFLLTASFIQFSTLFPIQDFKGKVGGIRANAVDTTGAGDAFVGGLLTNLAANLNLYKV